MKGSHFSSDEVNRMGLHKLMWDNSDRMWERGKETMKYILKRGGRMGQHFRVGRLKRRGTMTGPHVILVATYPG